MVGFHWDYVPHLAFQGKGAFGKYGSTNLGGGGRGEIAFFEFIEEYSVINGTKVAIGLSDSGYYYAEFLYKDVGFRLIANGISEEELVAILSSLIQ